MYPCDFDLPNIICVGASDRNGNLADYSDYGATSVDVAAPGGTDGNLIMSVSGSKQKYVQGEGSSLSAAFVSASAFSSISTNVLDSGLNLALQTNFAFIFRCSF